MAAPPTNAPLLHRFMGIGLVLLSVGAAAMKAAGRVPTMPPNDVTSTMALVFSGISVALVALAWLVFKPGVPERRPGQSIDEYWTTPDVVARIMRVWFLLEGAGVLGLVGVFLTGAPVAATAAALAVVSFWMCGPSRFGNP